MDTDCVYREHADALYRRISLLNHFKFYPTLSFSSSFSLAPSRNILHLDFPTISFSYILNHHDDRKLTANAREERM